MRSFYKQLCSSSSSSSGKQRRRSSSRNISIRNTAKSEIRDLAKRDLAKYWRRFFQQSNTLKVCIHQVRLEWWKILFRPPKWWRPFFLFWMMSALFLDQNYKMLSHTRPQEPNRAFWHLDFRQPHIELGSKMHSWNLLEIKIDDECAYPFGETGEFKTHDILPILSFTTA